MTCFFFRVEIGGIMPPVDRPESSCFDPGAKYHVATGVGYIRFANYKALEIEYGRM